MMRRLNRVIWIMGITGVLLLVGGTALGLRLQGVFEVRPDRVRPEDSVELLVRRPPGLWGLYWEVQRQQGLGWHEFGYVIAGPEVKGAVIHRHTGEEVAVPLVGFSGSAIIRVKVPESMPDGRYRIGQDFYRDGSGSEEERREWHWGRVPQSEIAAQVGLSTWNSGFELIDAWILFLYSGRSPSS